MKKNVFLVLAITSLLVLIASCTTTAGGEIPASTQNTGGDMESDSLATINPAELTGMWQGILKAGGQELRLVFHFDYGDGDYTATMDSPDQGASDIPMDSVTVEGRTIRADLKAASAYYEGTLSDDGTTVRGSWNQGGSSFAVDLARIDSIEKVTRPQDPAPPFPYEVTEVRFRNNDADISLAGTLTVPPGPGPFPAVVLVSGSGPQNRDEELMNHRPFLVIADYLTRRGVAVLRYDDRGVAQSEGDPATATGADFAEDAWAAFAFLSAQPEIDSKRVGIAGHSEGAIIAPMVAASHPEVAFIVLMAGTGFRGYDIVLQQTAAILRASGASEAQIAQAVATNRQLYDIVLSEPDDAKAIAELTKVMEARGLQEDQAEARVRPLISPWYRQFLAFDPTDALKKTKCPVLAICGSKDLQVLADVNLPAIKKAVMEGGNDDVTTIELEGLNHLFQHAETGLPQEYAQIEETFAPVALKTIGDWILERMSE